LAEVEFRLSEKEINGIHQMLNGALERPVPVAIREIMQMASQIANWRRNQNHKVSQRKVINAILGHPELKKHDFFKKPKIVLLLKNPKRQRPIKNKTRNTAEQKKYGRTSRRKLK